MSLFDRLDQHQFIGAPCEVDNCPYSVENDKIARCYDHNPQRLIEALFIDEDCHFKGVNCTETATMWNENDIMMCETCLNQYLRIQRAGPPLIGDPADFTLMGEIDLQALIESAEEEPEDLGEEECTCNNLDHRRYNQDCPLNWEPYLAHLRPSTPEEDPRTRA